MMWRHVVWKTMKQCEKKQDNNNTIQQHNNKKRQHLKVDGGEHRVWRLEVNAALAILLHCS